MKHAIRRIDTPTRAHTHPFRSLGTALHAWWNRLVCGYAYIDDPGRHVAAAGISGWRLEACQELPTVEPFPQSDLEPGAPNCALASIVRCLLYLKHRGPAPVTERAALYEQVRRIGVRHGYAPDKSGWFHDLFVYSPFCIARMVTESAVAAAQPGICGRSRYVRRLATLRRELDAGRPALLNIAFGDYPGHTVTIAGYRAYRGQHGAVRLYLRTIDGWRDAPSYIDWHRARRVPSSVTCFSEMQEMYLKVAKTPEHP